MMNMNTVKLPDGVQYLGMQEQPSGPGLLMFQDHVTGSSFVVEPGETVVQAADRKRKQFAEYEQQFATLHEADKRFLNKTMNRR